MPESWTRDQLVHNSLTASKILCFVAMILPLLSAVGLLLDIPWLTPGRRNLPVMHPNTALGILLGSLAVLLTQKSTTSQWRRWAALLLSSATLLLGLVTLSEYAFGWDAGTDRIFIHGAPAFDEPFPGRSSPQASLNLALLGVALVLFNASPRQSFRGQIAAALVGANALLVATGYIFGTGYYIGFPTHSAHIGMALPTALAFIFLVIALFCSRPTDGMMTLVTNDTAAGGMGRRILLATIVLPPLVGAVTRIGVVAGWYDVSAQISLFALAMIGLILRTTWRAARRSEDEELQARSATAATRRANERLRRAIEERQIFKALIDNSSDFIGIANANGTPTYLNPAGRRMVGVAADFPIENTEIADYYSPDQRAFASDEIVKSTLEHGHWEGESAFKHWQTGQPIPVSDTHFVIRSPETGETLGIGTITRDISDIKRAHGEVEAAHQRLQEANEELTRANGRAKELDQLKTHLFANISHELRTPLTLILGPVEKHLRSTTALGAELRQDLEVVRRNTRTVLRHVNDLLDLARLQAGRLKAEYTQEDAAVLVRSVADHFSALSKEKSIAFTVQAPPALPVQVDVDKLQRMLLNLLSNAFKFTPGGGRVRISLGMADGGFLVEVGDSGSGIPEGKRDEVFERFHQLETGVAQRSGGTGLGLSIVKDFAALLGGSISIGESPEGGALMVLALPSVAPPGTEVRPSTSGHVDLHDLDQLLEALRERRSAAPMDRVEATRLEGLVLVVEDNRDLNRFVAEALESRGFRVAVAFDGRDGYDTAIAVRPDLILTDLMMPVMSGDHMVRALRERPELNSTPIVVLTAKADQESRVRILRAGAQDYLDKPFSVEELCTRVQNLVVRKRAEDHNKRLRRHMEDVARAGVAVSEAVAVLPQASVQAVLEILALNARNLTAAEFVAAGIGTDPRQPFENFAFVGFSRELAEQIGGRPRPVGLLGLVQERAVRTRDLRELPEYRGFPEHHPVITSLLGVPIRRKGTTIGSLYMANKRDHAEFTEHDQRLVEMLVERADVAIETAQLFSAEGIKRAWLQAVIDQMPEGIVLMDGGGRVILQNRSMTSLAAAASPERDRFGNPVAVDLRRPSGERLSPDEMPIVKAIVDQATTQASELVALCADGRLVPLLVSAAPIQGEHGELVGATMIFQDVSTLKELEHLREEWASIVAHDLQQPIGVIVLRSDLLLQEGLSSKQQDEVAEVRKAAKRLSRMANDLMDASQLEAKRLHVSLNRIDLSQLLHSVSQRVPGAATRVEIRTPPNRRLFVNGDEHRLEQVVTNLLSNALKYSTPDTAIQIDVGEDQRNAQVQVSVTNRGRGIPEHELPSLFARFVRSRAARTSATTGSGLGLYIAKGLIEAHGGHIWAESIPDENTTFHFTIPINGPPAQTVAALDEVLHRGN